VFGRLGYRGASMREIADRVGLTDAGVMHHFGTKQQLLIAVLEHREAIARQGRPRQQGLALLDDLRDLVAANATMPGLVQLFVTVSAEATDPDHPAHEFFVARYEEVTRYFADQLGAARDAGQVRADVDLTAAAQQLIAMMDGLQVQYLLTKADMVTAFDQFLEGFRSMLGVGGASGVDLQRNRNARLAGSGRSGRVPRAGRWGR
jgi:AcrR family transcriptional regulator